MSAITIQQMADRVARLMEDRLQIRGRGLAEKLRRGRRMLPRKVRDAADHLADAAEMARNPKLLLRVDEAQVAAAYDICVRHLQALGARERRWALIVSMASGVAVSVLAVSVLVIAVLIWRGFVTPPG